MRLPFPTLRPAPSGARIGPPRLAVVDTARGLAIVQMVMYHFCYDLNHFGWIRAAMTRDPGWIAWRTAIVTQFLFLVGVSLALRSNGPRVHIAFTRRWWQIALCAALVSAGSALIFGPRWIWFGVLHFVLLAQLLVIPLRHWGRANLALGALLLATGLTLHFAVFAPNALSWIGFSPVKPQTEDFVPLLPWLGVVVLGIGAGNLWQASQGTTAIRLRAFAGGGWAAAAAAAAGRWPLTIYMLHQPLLFGAFWLLQLARGTNA